MQSSIERRRGRGPQACLAALISLACGGDGESPAQTGSESSTTVPVSTEGTSSTAITVTTAVDESSATTDTPAESSTTLETSGTTGEPIEPEVIFPRTSIVASELAVLVNDADPQSVAVADYYVNARQIPAANLVHLNLPAGAVLSQADFAAAKATVDAALGDEIQALAITWTQPYRVDCMSVTSAFALGFDPQYCATPCNPSAPVDYYDSPSFAPWTDHGIRPAMMLAGSEIAQIQALVDRGVAADATWPVGDGYLIRTTDADRSTRSPSFIDTVALFDHEGGLPLEYIDNSDGSGSDYIEDTQDVMFYFTGLMNVPQIATNGYSPGAMADHLTSYGGEVPTSSQMSVVAWLEAGATGSYGTVVEPCNFPAKFPNPLIATAHYFRGQTLIEAYWKSVAQPGEGLFVGEPLARPWDGAQVSFADGTLTIRTTLLAPGVDYEVQAGATADGPWETVFTGSVPYPVSIAIDVPDADAPYYRLVPS